MGYILPINHYQYQDYQNRTIQRERSPFVLERVFKSTLDSKLGDDNKPREEDLKEYQEMNERILYTPSTLHIAKEMIKKDQDEQVYSDVTGKGKNFSETI